MSNYSKGKRTEKIVADDLKERGFEIPFKSVFVRFHNIDFGPWDIVAVQEIAGIKVWMLVQCTTWQHRAERRENCLAWMRKYFLPGMKGYLVSKKGKEQELIWEELVI